MFRKERVLLTLAVAMSVVWPSGSSFQRDASIAGIVVRDVHVAFKESRVPTPGSHPHDPLTTSDGAIWYTGQMTNLLGRLDPKTEQFREYRLRTANSGPHGLVSDMTGNIWFTASFKGYIGKLDPVTGDIREFPLPDPKARDPHTPVFDQTETLWFTVIGGNMIGRLDPPTGEINLVPSPTTDLARGYARWRLERGGEVPMLGAFDSTSSSRIISYNFV